MRGCSNLHKTQDKNLYFRSTRSEKEMVLASEAIIKGIASDGGLYVPESFPKFEKSLLELSSFDYRELSFYILKKFFTDIEWADLKACIGKAYDEKFDNPLIVPLVEKKGFFFMELYHGPTLSFKDMALSILPHLLQVSTLKRGIKKEIVILTATSGDTGKAALEAFSNVEGTIIIAFYPKGGVSKIQERQMITQEGKNTFVIGVEGNFDDAQQGVKEIFSDQEIPRVLGDRYIFSSANSINIGRLFPQLIYYFYSYLNLLKTGNIKEGENINVVVPTGNFGNILASYYAKRIGLPINKLICSSNENNVLYYFIRSGVYDMRRNLKVSLSPSMDILVSSNLERLLYELCHHDPGIVRNLTEKLKREGKYEVLPWMKEGLKDFYSGFATDAQTLEAIGDAYRNLGYLIDPHTAVAYYVYKNYVQDTKDNTKTIIASTASPFKFPTTVLKAIGGKVDSGDEFSNLERLAEISSLPVPKNINDLSKKKVIHNLVCKKQEMKSLVLEILKNPDDFKS